MKTTHTNIIYFTSLLIISTLVTHCLSELCHPEDKKALLQLKKGFNDPWVFHTWDPQTDCCSEAWDGVECHPKTHRVITLQAYFGGTDLAGPIPPAIGDLPYLDVLWWHKSPNLTGPFPRAITKLQRLRFLVINRANLSGPIPSFLGQLRALEQIDLSFNNLSGPIPSSLADLPRLYGLGLDRNKLTGPVPESFGRFSGPNFYLKLSHNLLSGQIPASLGDKPDFDSIDLSRNRLVGDASMLLGVGKNRTIRNVDLSRNLLEFDLSRIEFPKSLSSLDLSHNRIFGSIPAGLAGVDHLFGLNVSYNRLCGEIPAGALRGFGETAYFHNRCLCGPPLAKACKKLK